MKVIDLTHTIEENMPVYPGMETPLLTAVSSYEANRYMETRLTMFSHTGTHIDSPAHIFDGGKTLDMFPAEQFIGRALVIDCRHLADGAAITMAELETLEEKLRKVDFLLFCLGWDKKWGTDEYFGDYPCIDDEVLDFILAGNYKGIGFDVVSPDPIGRIPRHRRLFAEKDTIIIENLKSLDLLGDEPVMFCCLPIKTGNSDGAPARAIAWFV